MKKRVLSLFMVLVLCLTLLPTAAFAEGEDVSISGGVIGGGETGGEGGGIYVAPGSPTEGGGGTYIPGEDTRTEIWCVSKPDSIGRTYDGTTDGSTIPLGMTFTDGTNTYTFTEGTDFTAKKTFDSADAGSHTVTVEIALIGDAAAKYKLKAGEETFTIGGTINKAYPELTVSLSETTCTVGEKLLPLLSISGRQENAAVTYYYTQFQTIAGYSDYEGSEAMPEIDENTAISEPGTYYVYAKTGETKNYEEERSTTAELTVNEAVVEAASVTKADGTDGGTYKSLPAALNAARDGDTVKLLANHVTDADALNALGEDFTFEQYASIVPVVTKTLTLDLNHKTVDYLEVGFTETNEETQKKETLATGNLTVTGEAAYGRISNLMFMAGALDIRGGEIGGSGCAGLFCDANSGSVTVSNGTVYGLTVLEGAAVTVNGGSNHAGEWVVASGATLNITDGTFGDVQFTRNGTIAISGGTFKSIKSYIAEELQPLMSLLDTQKVHAFYKGDDVQDGNATELADVTVKEHTHAMVNNKCGCGVSCSHDKGYTDGECSVCGYPCPHTGGVDHDGTCLTCHAQMPVKITASDNTVTYSTDFKAAMKAAENGTTVTLLADIELGTAPQSRAAITGDGKIVTLDLNGHKITSGWLDVGGKDTNGTYTACTLKIIGKGSYEPPMYGGIITVDLKATLDLSEWEGGTISAIDISDNSNYEAETREAAVIVGPKAGTIGKLTFGNNQLGELKKTKLSGGSFNEIRAENHQPVKLGELLEEGYAYQYTDGVDRFVEYTKTLQGESICNVKVVKCPHGGAEGFDESATTCPYCNAPAVAETALNNGEGGLWRRFADLQTALDADRAGSAEFKLLTDVTGDYTIDGTQDTALDLNGHSIKGTVTVKGTKGDRITTTLSNTQNTTTASIDKVVAYDGAKLAGSGYPAVIGELTLAEGATWKTILNDTALGYKVLNADGTHKWYARDDVKGSQLNNVIINRLPITSKTLYLKVGGKNLTGSSPKVERGTTVQLCASCNAKDVTVTFSILKTGETTPITLSGNDVQYTTVGTGTTKFYVAKYAFNDVGSYTISFTATKDGYTVTSNHKKLTVTKPNLRNAEITFRSSNESTYEPYNSTTTAPGFTVTYNGKTLKLGVDYTASGTASSAGVSTQTLTIKAVEGSDYTGSKTAEWRIVPHKAKVEVGDVIKAYDGTTDLPDGKISLVSAAGSAGCQAGRPLPLSEGNGFELTDAKYDSANASETEKNISFTVKLTDTNYTFEDGKTQKDFTLNGAELEDKSFKINKAAAPTNIPTGTLNVINGTHQTYTYDFSKLLPELSEGEYGTISYGNQAAISLVSQSGYYYDETIVEFHNGVLILAQFYAEDGTMTGQIGTVKVKVTTTNYEDFQLTLVLNAINKIKPTPDGKITASNITYGQALSDSSITGKMKDPNTGATVNGTFTWTDGTVKPDANDRYEAEWRFTPDESYGGGYATVTGNTTVKVAPKSIEGAVITLESADLEYNAAEQSPKITGVALEKWTVNITYRIVSGNTATNVNGSLTLTIEGTGNYTGKAAVKWKITPREVTPAIEVASCTYTGDALEPTVTLKDGAVVIPEGEYTVEYSNNTNAGTGRVAIQDVEGGNYIITSISRDFPIDQAAAPTNIQHGTLSVINGTHLTYTYDFQQLLPEAPNGDYGTVHYDLGDRQTAISFTAHGYYIDPEIVEFEGSKLTLVGLYAKDGTATGQIGTVKVNVTTTNYTDFNLTLVLNAVDRITPVADGSITASKITYGQTLSESRISGKMKDGDTVVEGTFSWQQPDDTILGASTLGHSVGWKFTPKDGNTYTEATGTATVKVDKAQQYGKVSMAGYTYGQAPSTPTLTDRTGDANAQVTYYYSSVGNGNMQVWSINDPPALNAGTYRMFARIGATSNYNEYNAEYCEFVVAIATPTYTVPTGLTAKYGQTLADVTLPDGWSWMDSSESVGGASTAAKTFQAKFTPKDTENYNTVENIELEVTVNKADGGNLKTVELEQKYTDASDHTYTPDWAGLPAGQDWTFSSEASIVLSKHDFAADGSLLTYAISGGKAGDKITITLKASCDNYEDFTITLNVTLTEKDDQKSLTITGAGSVVYGQTLTLTTSGGSGTGAVTYRIDTAHSTGEATIDPETGVLTPVKAGSVSVIATKAGDNDYNDVTSAPFVLMIKPATPTGEPNYTKITTSGKTLKDAALTTKGSTLNPSDGKLEWVDDKGNVLPDSTRIEANTTYRWRFTPTGANYATLTGKIELYHESSSGGGGWYDSYYTIEATAGTGGSISPSGNISVREGADQTFTITPDKGYAVANVKIDGESIGAVKSYTFENVSKAHAIEVIFVKGTASTSTGDSSNLLLWSALLLASTLTLAGAVHYKRKRAR